MCVYCDQKVGEHFCFVFYCSEMDEWWYFYTPFALLRWRRDKNMKIHHRIYIIHILIEILEFKYNKFSRVKQGHYISVCLILSLCKLTQFFWTEFNLPVI
jgi:hypothetical protein